jgi:pyrroloquinoline-quinone synthase
MTAALAPDDFEEALRAHAKHYHHQHPFHRRMNDGESSREEIRGWVANRFYYQVNIPRKDGAILSSCPVREVRRRWVQRVIDHDGTAEGEGGIESWLRLGEAVGLTREEMEDERHILPGASPWTPISTLRGPSRGSRRWPPHRAVRPRPDG